LTINKPDCIQAYIECRVVLTITAGLFGARAALDVTAVSAQTLTSNPTGINNGFYYTFWKDSGSASMIEWMHCNGAILIDRIT